MARRGMARRGVAWQGKVIFSFLQENVVKSIPELSVDTRLLYQVLVGLSPGASVTYRELSKVIGRDVQTKARHHLSGAMRKALSEGVVTESVRNEAVKRLTDAEIVSCIGGEARGRQRRIAGKAIRKLSTVKYESLSPVQRVKHNAELSQLGALKAFAGDRIAVKLEKRVGQQGEQLAIAKTLEAFED